MLRNAAKISWKTRAIGSGLLLFISQPGWAARGQTAKPDAKPTSKEAPAAEGGIECDDDPDCMETVQRAINQSDGRDYEAALKTYEAVYQRWPTPWLLINLGRVQQKMGRPADAVQTFRRYLELAPDDKRQRITVARAYLKQAEQELQIGRYEQLLVEAKSKERPIYKKWWFWTAIGGAAVTIAAVTTGVVVGTRPSEARTPPTNYINLSLRLAGF